MCLGISGLAERGILVSIDSFDGARGLHLVGFTHDNDSDGAEMEMLEIQILSSLGIEDPYQDSDSAFGDNASNAART